MEEKTLWTQTPSQIVNVNAYLIISFTLLAIYPVYTISGLQNNHGQYTDLAIIGFMATLLGIMMWKWLTVKLLRYTLTTERLIVRTGVFNFEHSEIELYRFRDYTLDEPLVYRFFKLGTIVLVSSDRTHPRALIEAIPEANKILKIIRDQVENCRIKKNVKEVDFT